MKKLFLLIVVCLILKLSNAQQWTTTGTNIYNSNTGNVGIGTTNPAAKFHVSGGHIVASKDDSLSGFVQLWNDNAIIWKNGNVNGGLRLGSATNLGAANWSEKMRITDPGNVGIGMTPVFKLDINSPNNDGATRLRLANTASSGINAAGSLPAIEVLGARGDGNASFEGRLALGTRRTDGTALSNQTLGAVLFGGQYGTDNSFQSTKILYSASIQGIAEGTFTNSTTMPVAIAFFTSSTGNDVAATNFSYGIERMRITNSGNIGIGTTNPGPYKLAVEGTLGARKIKVTQANPWADYVFEGDYKLPSLADVEKYIQQNKHLPDVPSAKEVEDNGLDVGNNETILLKKIEELTLYIIRQQKDIERLQSENNDISELKREVDSLKNSIRAN